MPNKENRRGKILRRFFSQILTIFTGVVSYLGKKEAMRVTELSKEILESYQVRKTVKQKKAFIELLQKHIPTLQVQKMRMPQSRNLVIGDPQTAKVVLTAHYDTCAILPFPNFITPKRAVISILYSFLVIIPWLAAIFLLNLLLSRLVTDYWLHYWLSLICYFILMWMMISGPANKHTANDNTSGVITLLEIYAALPEEQRDKVCFVFFDNEEKGVIGSAQFRKKYKKQMNDKLLINYDCVSDGDHFLFGISKKANQKYHVAISRAFSSDSGKSVMLENLKKVYYPSDQAGFPLAIAVAALKHNKIFGYYMDRIHTKRDTVFDESNITFLTEKTLTFIANM